ncbi:PHD zinc finger, partial [Rhizoctonia solani]
MGRASLRAMPLAHLKAYLNAYGLRAPPHAVEKEDYVRAVLDARQNNGCLPKANEDYYRRHSIPQPTGERPKGFLARMAESFSDFVDSLPQPELSTHVNPPPVPPRHTAPRPPPPPPPRPQAAPSPPNARPTPQQPQHNPPPPPPSTQRPAPQAVPIEELLAMNSEEISALSIGKLKAILQHHHVRIPQDALEKRDLVDRVVTLVEAARVAKEREARLKAAEEEAELEAQRQALEEIDRRKKASAQKDDAGTSEGRESQVDVPVGLPKASAHAATKLERDGLCVICQDEDANIAIVDCGLTPWQLQIGQRSRRLSVELTTLTLHILNVSVHKMSNIIPYNQLEYQPFQVAPPLNSSNLAQPPIQQPNLVAQQQLQVQPQARHAQPSPRPGEYEHNVNSFPYTRVSYPTPPSFDWIVPAITSLLHSQHAATFAKFNEASEQQLALAAKVETLQATTNSLQQTVNAILENIQQVSDRVGKLGADMSSRDATLAERLNALDDAIDTWSPDVRRANEPMSRVPPIGELRTPPKSDELRALSGPQSLTGDVLEPQCQQLHSLRDLIRDASPLENDGISAPGPNNNNISRLSTTPRISSDQPIAQPDAEFTVSLVQQSTKVAKTPGRAKSRKSDASSQITLKATRRSARKVKRRQRDDGTTEIPVLKKKIKLVPKTEEGVSGKAPRKSGRLEFNWKNVPIQEAELEQLIYCDKCDRAYHWGCVNILPEDPILQQEADWLCPPCEFGAQHGTTSGHTYDPNTKCRPDCPAQDNEDVMFAIDAIIGRFPHSADLSGAMMQYLVKWEDYTVQQSTWTPENEIGQAAHALIRDFETAALKENLEVNDRSQLILLKEARDGGWGYYTFPS